MALSDAESAIYGRIKLVTTHLDAFVGKMKQSTKGDRILDGAYASSRTEGTSLPLFQLQLDTVEMESGEWPRTSNTMLKNRAEACARFVDRLVEQSLIHDETSRAPSIAENKDIAHLLMLRVILDGKPPREAVAKFAQAAQEDGEALHTHLNALQTTLDDKGGSVASMLADLNKSQSHSRF